MPVSLKNILSLLDKNKIDYSVLGTNIVVKEMAAITKNIRKSLCYYVGDEPSDLFGIECSIIICRHGLAVRQNSNNTIIFTNNPQLCFYLSSYLFIDKENWGINGNSVVDPEAKMGTRILIGPFCHIENCIIGNEVIVESGVKIYRNIVIGDRVQIQSNSVIGANGVMWTWNEKGKKVKCAQTGIVIIENDVFIGSNITIVKGAFRNKNTVIGHGTMIAHGTMIGHGAVIGPNNHFANNVSIAGSVTTGENCFFGSGSVVRPHIKIADDTIIGAGAVVVSNFDQESGLVIAGNPAKILKKKRKSYSGVPSNNFII